MVSFIIPTKNEEKNIQNCLESIKRQDFDCGRIEIIVVDNNSTDKTREIAREYTDKVFTHGTERSSQRNFGACQAKAEILGFIDADMILSAGVIDEVIKKFEQDENLAGLYINEKIVDFQTGFPPDGLAGSQDQEKTSSKEGLKLKVGLQTGFPPDGRAGSQDQPPLKWVRKSFFCKTRNFERQFYNMTVIDAVRFMRRDDFFACGGFDENLFACEDWDLNKRIKKIAQTMEFDILKSAIYHNEAGSTLKKLLAKKKYYSADFEKYINKWGRKDMDIKKQFGFWYRCFGVFLEKGKWRRLISHPILAMAMFAYKIMVGIVYLNTKNQETI